MSSPNQPATIADPQLAARVRRSERRRRMVTLLLLAPSIIFVAMLFAAPVGMFLFRSIDNGEISGSLPRTAAALGNWDGQEPVPDAAYAALSQDLFDLKDDARLPVLARRLNYNVPQFRGLIIRTAQRIDNASAANARERLTGIDSRWADIRYWTVLRAERHAVTSFYFLAALDLQRTTSGEIARAPPDTAIFVDLYLRTFLISGTVTLLCVLLGFPVALTMASTPPHISNVLLMLVLVPFWTSLLVRAMAWIVLLQSDGIVNQTLRAIGLIDKPVPLIFNRAGLYISMVQVLLPFAILPMYSTIKGLPADITRAAASLGAKPYQRFIYVFLPQAAPGIMAGGVLVFVMSLGYYVAPALVGGPREQMIGYFIAYFTNSAVNWGMASALGVILLIAVAVLYAIVGKLTRFERLSSI